MIHPRRLWGGLLAAILATTGLTVVGSVEPAAAANFTCTSSTRVVSLRGSGEPYGNDGLGVVNAAAYQEIKRRIPDVQLYGVPYEAVSILPNPADKLVNQYWQSMSLGSVMLGRVIDQIIAACPNQRLILLAYSQGMHALGQLLAAWGNNPVVRSHIAAILGFGDPMFNPANPFDRDAFGQPGFNRSLHGVFGSRTVSSVWWNTMRSYCADQDWICNYSKTNFAKCPPWTSQQCGHFSYVASGTAASAGAWAGNLARSLPPLGSTLPKAGPPPPPPAAQYYVHHVYHASAGLYIRSAPNTGGAIIGGLPDGSEVRIVCQAHGQRVLPGSDIWDRLTNSGWAYDWYIDTPGVGNFSPPIPVC